MANDENKRRFKRLNTSWIVRLRRGLAGPDTKKLLAKKGGTTISNISSGGVFIETSLPFELGEVVEFDFALPGKKHTVHARGIVKWSNNGRYKNQPLGMGIEFLEVTTEDRTRIEKFIEREGATKSLAVLTRTKIHQALLLLYSRKIGESFSLDVLSQFLSCQHHEVMEALSDFSTNNLVTMEGAVIRFVATSDTGLARNIAVWCEGFKRGDTPTGGSPIV